MNRRLVLTALLTLASSLASADERFRLAADLGRAPRSASLLSVSSYPELAELTSLTATQELGGSQVLAGEAQFRFARHVGVALAFQRSSQTGSAEITASVPHPFLFGQPRQVAGRADKLDYSERAFHVDLVALATRGRLALRGFAGVSFFSVRGELIRKIAYTSAYPFDTAAFDSAVVVQSEGSAAGFNLGAGVDLNLGRRFALGAQARFSRASVALSASAAAVGPSVSLDPAEVDAGGFAATAGVRVRF